jgi:hypothetical protein
VHVERRRFEGESVARFLGDSFREKLFERKGTRGIFFQNIIYVAPQLAA